MNRICKTVPLIAFVALLFIAGPAFTETLPAEPATTATPVAYVYVQTHQGINVYGASAAGKLTLVKGSPFATVGQVGGINGKYLISVGTDYLRSYAIESNGAVGKQASENQHAELWRCSVRKYGWRGGDPGSFGKILLHRTLRGHL